MQHTIIDALSIFAFDSSSMQQQFDVEKNTLLDLLRAKYPATIAAAKYNTICNNIKCYFLQNYNIALQ